MPHDEPIPQLRLYREWLDREYGLRFADYAALWQWSTTDLAGFWRSIWDYHQLGSPTPFTSVVDGRAMPGATWFDGAQVNYARQVFRHVELAEAAGLCRNRCRERAGAKSRSSAGRSSDDAARRSRWNCAASAWAGEIGLQPIFPTFLKPSLRCSLAQAWVLSGPCARPIWVRLPCSTAFGRHRRRR